MTAHRPAELWIIQPLLDAGLDLDEIRGLLFRVGFDSRFGTGPWDVRGASAYLGHRSYGARAAWIETVDRMLCGPHADLPR